MPVYLIISSNQQLWLNPFGKSLWGFLGGFFVCFLCVLFWHVWLCPEQWYCSAYFLKCIVWLWYLQNLITTKLVLSVYAHGSFCILPPIDSHLASFSSATCSLDMLSSWPNSLSLWFWGCEGLNLDRHREYPQHVILHRKFSLSSFSALFSALLISV